MPAYLTPIVNLRCQKCPRLATARLRNTNNADIGYYCDEHAPAALKEYIDIYERAY